MTLCVYGNTTGVQEAMTMLVRTLLEMTFCECGNTAGAQEAMTMLGKTLLGDYAYWRIHVPKLPFFGSIIPAHIGIPECSTHKI